MLTGIISPEYYWIPNLYEDKKYRKQGRKPRPSGLTEGLPGEGNCHATGRNVSHPLGRWHDNFPPFAPQRAKKVLFANHLLNHITHPLFARPAESAGASIGKNSGLPLHPLPLFRENENYFFLGGGFPGYSTMLTTEKVSLRLGVLLGCGYPVTVICASLGRFAAISLVCR